MAIRVLYTIDNNETCSSGGGASVEVVEVVDPPPDPSLPLLSCPRLDEETSGLSGFSNVSKVAREPFLLHHHSHWGQEYQHGLIPFSQNHSAFLMPRIQK
jgi:hypothetical protein